MSTVSLEMDNEFLDKSSKSTIFTGYSNQTENSFHFFIFVEARFLRIQTIAPRAGHAMYECVLCLDAPVNVGCWL